MNFSTKYSENFSTNNNNNGNKNTTTSPSSSFSSTHSNSTSPQSCLTNLSDTVIKKEMTSSSEEMCNNKNGSTSKGSAIKSSHFLHDILGIKSETINQQQEEHIDETE